MLAKAGDLLPRLAAVAAAEERGILDAGVDGVRVSQRGLQMPHPLELPGMRRPVIPLMGAGHAVVGKLIAHRFPGLAAVVRALHHLAEPAARLRAIDPAGVGGRPLEVVDLPPGEVRAAHRPLFPLPVGTDDEPALAGPHQQAYSAHLRYPPELTRWLHGAGPVPALRWTKGPKPNRHRRAALSSGIVPHERNHSTTCVRTHRAAAAKAPRR